MRKYRNKSSYYNLRKRLLRRERKPVIFRIMAHIISVSLMLFSSVVLHTILNSREIYIFTESYFYRPSTNVNFFGQLLDKIFVVDLCIVLGFIAFFIEFFINLYDLYLKP